MHVWEEGPDAWLWDQWFGPAVALWWSVDWRLHLGLEVFSDTIDAYMQALQWSDHTSCDHEDLVWVGKVLVWFLMQVGETIYSVNDSLSYLSQLVERLPSQKLQFILLLEVTWLWAIVNDFKSGYPKVSLLSENFHNLEESANLLEICLLVDINDVSQHKYPRTDALHTVKKLGKLDLDRHHENRDSVCSKFDLLGP